MFQFMEFFCHYRKGEKKLGHTIIHFEIRAQNVEKIGYRLASVVLLFMVVANYLDS